MIDLATSWIEICSVPEARVDQVTNQVELVWLTRYPLPNIITVDRGKEFLAELKIMMANDYRNSSTLFTIRSMVHTTMQHTLSQLVFGRDTILNINQEANWQFIKKHKHDLKNNCNQ